MSKINRHAALAAVCLALLVSGTASAKARGGSGIRAEPGVKVSTMVAGLQGGLPDLELEGEKIASATHGMRQMVYALC